MRDEEIRQRRWTKIPRNRRWIFPLVGAPEARKMLLFVRQGGLFRRDITDNISSFCFIALIPILVLVLVRLLWRGGGMAAVFFYHVVGDLTVGKPEVVEFSERASVGDAIEALRDCTECGIPVWKQKRQKGYETAAARQERFVGILSALDIIAHLSSEGSLKDLDAALKVPVSDIVIPNNALLRQVDPATRLQDALEIMKQGVRRMLVPLTVGSRGTSKRFSVLYNGKWLEGDGAADPRDRWCCLSREDVIRFLIGRLGALAPVPLTSIQSLGAISHLNVKLCIHSRSPARDAVKALSSDPQAVPVVEESDSDGDLRLIGEISAFKLWKCDLVAAAWALANLTAAEFVTGVEDIVPCTRSSEPLHHLPPIAISSKIRPNPLKSGNAPTPADGNSTVREEKARRFSTRSLDFLNLYFEKSSPRPYRGRSAPLTCRPTNSLAAVMAQMLSHRATHVWVTQQMQEDEENWGENESLVGIVTYADVLSAVTRLPNSISPS